MADIGYPKPGFRVLEEPWSNEFKTSGTRLFFIFWPNFWYIYVFVDFSKLSTPKALRHFEMSSNMPKIGKKRTKNQVQLALNPFFWLILCTRKSNFEYLIHHKRRSKIAKVAGQVWWWTSTLNVAAALFFLSASNKQLNFCCNHCYWALKSEKSVVF